MENSRFITMESFVITITALMSFGALSFQARARAFYVLFLHLLLLLTVGSLTFRTLSGGGTLLVPFVNGWPHSPFLQLTHARVYSMLSVSLFVTVAVSLAKIRIIWVTYPEPIVSQSFIESPYCCLMMLWIHLVTIFSLSLL